MNENTTSCCNMNVNEIEAILDDISLRKKLSIGMYN
jgi:hypothetical protein